MDILGIKVNNVTFSQSVDTIESWLKDKTSPPRYLVTPNPEIIVYAQKDKDFAKILNCADLSIPDGSGLIWASKILASRKSRHCHLERSERSPSISERVTGTDLMLKLCSLAPQKNWTIGLIGAGVGIAQQTADNLRRQFPGIKIDLINSGGKVDTKGNLLISNLNIENSLKISNLLAPKNFKEIYLEKLKIDLLFVAFGFPKQEYWIAKNKDKFPARIFIPVGGAFDIIAGKVKRAPKLVQQLGLEWLFRLIQQPSRLPRHLTASKFFFYVLFNS